MKTREIFDKIRHDKKPHFSLSIRLTLTITAEIIGSILVALGLSFLINYLLPESFKIPLKIEVVAIVLIALIFITAVISKRFFRPIKELCRAMEKVADGDYKIRLKTKSSSKEIKEMYSGFNLMVHELDATEILQSDFVSNVSHEFKTPISAVEGYATLLQDCENLTDEQKEYVDKIVFNTGRLSNLVGNILLLSKIDNRAIIANTETFRLDEQIRQSIVMLESQWEKKDIELDVDMEDIDYTGGESILHHVWDNIIGNAIKFSPVGGKVKIRLNKDKNTIVFTVDDEGPGISEEAHKHIFDKFYQGDSSHKVEGNGLGLALVKRIITAEGGEISAGNLEDKGCRFTVKLNIK